MKSLTWLAEGILLDSSMRCGANTHRDFVTLSRRVEHEGISFLTITLPKFASDFERSLETGFVGPTSFEGFSKLGALPRFLGGLLDLVFNRDDGRLQMEPSIDAILSVRQVCLAFKKLNLQCSQERVKEALDGYHLCENELSEVAGFFEPPLPGRTNPDGGGETIPRTVELGNLGQTQVALPHSRGVFRSWRPHRFRGRPLCGGLYDDFVDVSRCLWTDVFAGQVGNTWSASYRPKHGPGATAEKVRGNAKYLPGRWHTRLEPYFPIDANGVASIGAIEDGELDKFEFVEPGSEQPVRVTPVPKTLKGPRIIAIEPVCMQYTQQGLERVITERLSSHPLTAGQINFTDQSINRELALNSSKSGKYATLDLSEASDRVLLNVVRTMLQSVPDLLGALEACRSNAATLPDGRTIHLVKFASMGSANCFPVLSMVLYSIVLTVRMQLLSLPLSRRSLLKASRDVFVYGDDLIVPADEVPAISAALEAFALKVNTRKSFWTGKFRESCGMDAYDGVCVTPTYIRHLRPTDRQQSDRIVSFVKTANLFYQGGWWFTARRMREMVTRLIGELPTVMDTSAGLGWKSFLGYSAQRWNKSLMRFEVRAPVLVPKRKSSVLDGWPALLKCFLYKGEEPLERNHLQSVVLRGEANIKRRWVTPF
nr:MAG: hypothetical protein 3 [Leviviridae sp.]